MIKRLAVLAALAAALLFFNPPGVTHAAVAVCDAQRAGVCAGLVDWFSFEEASDTTRFGSFRNMALFEADGKDITRNTTYKVFGSGALQVGDGSQKGLIVPRGGGLTSGRWTVAVWVYVPSADSTGTPITLINTTVNSSSNDGALFQIKYLSSNWRIYYEAYENETGTTVSHSGTQNISTNAWHLLTITMSPLGDYGKSRVCTAVDNSSFECTSLTYTFQSFGGDMQLGYRYASGVDDSYNTVYIDGLGLWNGVAWDVPARNYYYNSGSGRAFPFY